MGPRLGVGVTLVALLSGRPARAQDAAPPSKDPTRVREGDPLRAQALFDEALTLSDQGRWSEACPKFRESLAADPGVGTLLNVASCSARENKPLEAARHYRRVLELNAITKDVERKRVVDEQAKTALKELAARLGRVSLKVSPAAAPAKLTIDGVAVEPAVAVELEVGEHALRAEAVGFEPWESKVVLIGGQNLEVPVALSRVSERGVGGRSGGSSPLLTSAWVTGFVGAGALATGGALLGLAAGRAAAIRSECGSDVDPPSCPRGSAEVADELASEGQAFAVGGYVGLGVGAAALGSSVVMLIVDATRDDDTAAPLRVGGFASPSAAFVGLEGAF